MPSKPKPAAPKVAKRNPAAESICSILNLLRGLEDVLVGSAPNPEEVRALFASLKSPEEEDKS